MKIELKCLQNKNKQFNPSTKKLEGSVVECLPGMTEALDSVPNVFY